MGYPAGHGQDSNINDHHFHWGYFIHAAAFMEQFQPGWSDQWGDMINLLVRDAASSDRNDALLSLSAPDFTLPDFNGKLHSLTDFRRQRVLLITWASW